MREAELEVVGAVKGWAKFSDASSYNEWCGSREEPRWLVTPMRSGTAESTGQVESQGTLKIE
jgi:hypothetical protein